MSTHLAHWPVDASAAAFDISRMSVERRRSLDDGALFGAPLSAGGVENAAVCFATTRDRARALRRAFIDAEVGRDTGFEFALGAVRAPRPHAFEWAADLEVIGSDRFVSVRCYARSEADAVELRAFLVAKARHVLVEMAEDARDR